MVRDRSGGEFIWKAPIGSIKGLRRYSVIKKKIYFSFQGIRYGEAPVGPNRFKDPIPAKPWEGVVDAIMNGEICPQIDPFSGLFLGEEDCLFLNVHVPLKLTDHGYDPKQPLLPVMVFIHGGGFTYGSGTSATYGPDHLLDEDVIVVTINYRLGVFGFLSLGNSDVPGNAGLKDQILALKWVQNNIKYFYGDNKNVTLFGESAGAASVHYHTLSPLSIGLFHRVILQSGTALNAWAYCKNPVERAFRLGKLLEFETDDVQKLAEFLRNQPAETLVTISKKVLENHIERLKLIFPFVPCKEVPGTGANFITEDPETLFRAGKFQKIPFIIGMTNKEGIIVLKDIHGLYEKIFKIREDPMRYLPYDLCRDDLTLEDEMIKRVKWFYFENRPIEFENVVPFTDMVADTDFLLSTNKFLKIITMFPEVPVYTFLFSFCGQFNLMRMLTVSNFFGEIGRRRVPRGASHGDDLWYIFFHRDMFRGMPEFRCQTSPEVKVIHYICKLWTNYAKTGDPNDKSLGIQWNPYTVKNPSYVNITERLRTAQNEFFPKRSAFWRKLYKFKDLQSKL